MKTKTRAKRTPKDKPWQATLTFLKDEVTHEMLRRCLKGDQLAIDALGALLVPSVLAFAEQENWLGYTVRRD